MNEREQDTGKTTGGVAGTAELRSNWIASERRQALHRF